MRDEQIKPKTVAINADVTFSITGNEGIQQYKAVGKDSIACLTALNHTVKDKVLTVGSTGTQDIVTSGLIDGLVLKAVKTGPNQIDFKLSGIANTEVADGTTFTLVIKNSAVKENALDSDPITFTINRDKDVLKTTVTKLDAKFTVTGYEGLGQYKGVGKDFEASLTVLNHTVKDGGLTVGSTGTEDIVTSGLPEGLNLTAVKKGDNEIDLFLSGTANTAVSNGTIFTVVIKNSAVIDDALDSDTITFIIIRDEDVCKTTANSAKSEKLFTVTGNEDMKQYKAVGKDNVATLVGLNHIVKDEELTIGSTGKEDIVTFGLPEGLTLDAVKNEAKQIDFTLSGIANTEVADGTTFTVIIKNSAVKENALDSDPIVFTINRDEDILKTTAAKLDGKFTVTGNEGQEQYKAVGKDSAASLTAINHTVKDGGLTVGSTGIEDIVALELPEGLTLTAVKNGDNQIDFTLCGTANTEVIKETVFTVVIKNSAVVEDALDSEPITFVISRDADVCKITATAAKCEKLFTVTGNEGMEQYKAVGKDSKASLVGLNHTVKDGEVTVGSTGKEDIVTFGLPVGLILNAVKNGANQIDFTLSGKSNVEVVDGTTFTVVINNSAVNEEALNSDPIIFIILRDANVIKTTATSSDVIFTVMSTEGENQYKAIGKDSTASLTAINHIVKDGELTVGSTGDEDIVTKGLPTGITLTAVKKGANQIDFTMSGTADVEVAEGTTFTVVIKNSAVYNESLDSDPIEFTINRD